MNAFKHRQLMYCRCGTMLNANARGLVVEKDCPEVCCNWSCIVAAGMQARVHEKQYCHKHLVWHLGHDCPLCEMGHRPGGHHG